jgi:hypothetical protein
MVLVCACHDFRGDIDAQDATLSLRSRGTGFDILRQVGRICSYRVPLRGDLLADLAMASAAPVLKPDKAAVSAEKMATRERAIAARQSLSLSPHSSITWLLIAMLQSQGQARKSNAEALSVRPKSS